MQYIQLSLIVSNTNEDITDLLSYHLGNIGYESFVSSNQGLDAYIPVKDFSEQKLKETLQDLSNNNIALFKDVIIDYKFNYVDEVNWNKKWEENYFKPLSVSDKCLVKSSFHQVDKRYDYEITIDPKMAFGTGHHQTTYLMLQEILKLNMKDSSVLDMGCGTAVLAILASKMGASDIVAVDFDEWAYQNAKENVKLNNVSNIDVRLGEISAVKGEKFDFIFANINRNILLQDIEHYAKVLDTDGTLIMSGFYFSDIPHIKDAAEKNNFTYVKHTEKDNWVAVLCMKD